MIQKLEHAADQRIDGQLGQIAALAARKGEQLTHEFHAVIGAAFDDIEQVAVGGAVMPIKQHRHRGDDRAEHIVQVVGDAAREQPQHLQALVLHQLLLDFLLFGDIGIDDQNRPDNARVVADQSPEAIHDRQVAPGGLGIEFPMPFAVEEHMLPGRFEGRRIARVKHPAQFAPHDVARFPSVMAFRAGIPKSDAALGVDGANRFARFIQKLRLLVGFGFGPAPRRLALDLHQGGLDRGDQPLRPILDDVIRSAGFDGLDRALLADRSRNVDKRLFRAVFARESQRGEPIVTGQRVV